MNCNLDIHNGITEMNEIICPFCDKKLVEVERFIESCCDKSDVEKDDYKLVCKNCGSVHGYVNADEFVDFYDNIYKIWRKSIYHREYHIEDKITNLCSENKYQISPNDKQKVIRVFEEIDKILPQIDQNIKENN